MFEIFRFTQRQTDDFFNGAKHDFTIATQATVPDVTFRFAYDALIKLAIAICADHGLRVKAQQGHHVELIEKLAEYLGDPEIQVVLNKFRQKRNWNLYYGGTVISEKAVAEYLTWTQTVFGKAQQYFNRGKLL